MHAEQRARSRELEGALGPTLLLAMASAMLALGPLLQGLGRGVGSILCFGLSFVVLPCLLLGRDHLRPITRPRVPLIALGALTGLLNYGVALALQALPLAALGFAPPEPESLFASQSRLETWALATAICLAAPLCEEFAFRRALQPLFVARFAPRLGILLTALAYAAIHLDVAGFAARVEMGVAFGLLAHWSRSLWPAVAAHAVHNLVGLACLFFAPMPESAAPADVESGLALWALVSALATACVLWGVRRLQAAPCGQAAARDAEPAGSKENAPSPV